MSRRFVAPLLLVLLVLLAPAPDAHACSCADEPPRVRLSQAEAAFVGTVTRVEPAGRGEADYTFAVESVVKGRLGATVVVRAPAEGPSCGFELAVGERDGILLHGDGTPWESNLCLRIAPDELAAAARPFAVPPARGVARLLLPGAFGDAGLVALGGAGRLAGYVFATEGNAVSVCPGGTYAVQAGNRLHVIRLRDLRVVRRSELPGDDASAVRCLSRTGREAVVMTYAYGSRSERQALLRVRSGRVTTLRRLGLQDVVLGTRSGHVLDERGIAHLPYDGAAMRRVASVRGVEQRLALSPDERRIVLTTGARRVSLVIVDVRTGRSVRRAVRGVDGAPVWLSSRSVAVEQRRFDVRLRGLPDLRASVGGYSAAADGYAWTLGYRGDLRRLSLSGGAARTLTGFDLAGARGLVALPDPVRVAGERRAPSPVAAASRGRGCAKGRSG